jgi:ferrous iron transport protein B
MVAIVGNPNTGKSTLFTALTGFRQQVGNYPGTTVESRSGLLAEAGKQERTKLIDLPGTYSLAAHAKDEAIVLDVLLGQQNGRDRPDAIVVVADASNLARNLFLTTQIMEVGPPVIVALNMIDVARNGGIEIDAVALSKELGVPVIPVIATQQVGIETLKAAIVGIFDVPRSTHCADFPDCVCKELDGLSQSISLATPDDAAAPSRVETLQTLLDPGGYHEERLIACCGQSLARELVERRKRIQSQGESISAVEGRVRYAWIDRVVEQVVKRERPAEPSVSDRVDRVATHPILGLLVLVLLMGICFQSVYAWAEPLMNGIDGAFGALGHYVGGLLGPGALQSLVQNGVVAGVGAILVFLPQILILFLFLAILEDCGYLARTAFLLDRWMGFIGLNGKSFIPLLSSFACAVPGIMATRTIDNRRDRFVTMLIAPLMSCSARLPVYILLIGAFVPATSLFGGAVRVQALTLIAFYFVGVLVAIPVALLLKCTILKGDTQAFLMELPTYKWPSPRTVIYRVYEQGREFVVSAGTIIFAVAVVVWALGYYPRPPGIATQHEVMRVEARAVHENNADATTLPERLAEIDRLESGTYLRQSLLGRMGRWIEPVVEPLGWDWRIGMAAIASFPAREVVIATMGTIYNLGDDQDQESVGLRNQLLRAKWPDGRPVYNLAVALSVMVFFSLCCQCGATLAVIRRETNSWRWPLFTFTYMTTLAYVGALITYQVTIRLIS